jgi:hypothetical protein
MSLHHPQRQISQEAVGVAAVGEANVHLRQAIHAEAERCALLLGGVQTTGLSREAIRSRSMSNRSQHRKDVARMRHELSGSSLLTWLVPADAKLDEPLLRRAVKFWRGNIQTRHPFCPSCRANYADAAEVGMFLLATPASPAVVGFVTLIDTAALMAWLHRDALLKRVDAEITAEADDTVALSPAKRQKQGAEVMGDLLAAERDEAALVWRAQGDGLPVEHRADASPLAVLGVKLVAAKADTPSGTSVGLSWAWGGGR